MAVGSICLFALYGLRCARTPQLRHKAPHMALLALVFSAVFGAVLARVSYALLMQELDFAYDGVEALAQLLWFRIDNLSFFGGAAGVCLGVALASRLTNKGAMTTALDAFAPFGALLVALFRFGESFFASYGCGTSLPEDSVFARFPFALYIEADGGYGYWSWAVCILSAAFALLAAGIAFTRVCKGRPGLCFTFTLFFLALPQILCESLRRRGMFWLFVHVEQVLCALVLLGVMLCWTLTVRRRIPRLQRWLPMAGLALCVGLMVADEFAIDGKLFDIAPVWCYLFMSLVLVMIGVCGCSAMKRWNHAS